MPKLMLIILSLGLISLAHEGHHQGPHSADEKKMDATISTQMVYADIETASQTKLLTLKTQEKNL